MLPSPHSTPLPARLEPLREDGSKSYPATVVVGPRGRGGALLFINGRTFVLRGAVVRGLRDMETRD